MHRGSTHPIQRRLLEIEHFSDQTFHNFAGRIKDGIDVIVVLFGSELNSLFELVLVIVKRLNRFTR